MPTLATVKKFLREHSLGVLATVDKNGQPTTTPITFATVEKGLVFVTTNKTTKSMNLELDRRVSLSVVDNQLPIAVNLTGTVDRITNPKDIKDVLSTIGEIDRHKPDLPPVLKHNRGDHVTYLIKPARIQYTNFTKAYDKKQKYIFDI